MQTFSTVYEMQAYSRQLRARGVRLGFVPTMGALHAGHLSLIDRARAAGAQVVVVSIFVNPTQFGPNEDLSKYPKPLEADLALCRERGVDVVFTPSDKDMYPEGHSTWVFEDKLSQPLCGQSRPSHFRGVTTVVAMLFNIVQPHLAVFGEKDAQQLALIRKMVRDLYFDLEIVPGPTVREPDGLALSSRNRYLTPAQRPDALTLYQALQKAREMAEQGIRNTDRLRAEIIHRISAKRRLRTIYVDIVHKDTMEPLRELVPGHTLIAIAVWLDEVRLIDNIVL